MTAPEESERSAAAGVSAFLHITDSKHVTGRTDAVTDEPWLAGVRLGGGGVGGLWVGLLGQGCLQQSHSSELHFNYLCNLYPFPPHVPLWRTELWLLFTDTLLLWRVGGMEVVPSNLQ